MAVTGSISPILRDVALFRDLPETELAVLAHQVVRREYGRNELIFSQGDRGDGLYIVADGHVRISRDNVSGDEVIITLHDVGEYFGELALFDDEPRSASATAEDRTVVLFLSRSIFREFLESHPAALFSCLQVVVRQLRRCTDLVDELALMDVRSRLARRLLSLDRGGMLEGADNTFRLTQQHLAHMTGATRESVNKHLNALVDEGVVQLWRGRIRILDREALEGYALGSF
jgi:CRP/FNR family transcriptional regulator, cyclic AMP receptor protein